MIFMSDDFSIPVQLPLDADGFLRRECPTCEQEFKWSSDDGLDEDAEPADQYFCPRCGRPAGLDEWWTPDQLEYAQGVAVASPDLDSMFRDQIDDAFKGIQGVSFKPNQNFSLDNDTPAPLSEPDDMVIVEPPCHPQEPLKVPNDATERVHCLVCGTPFTA